MRTVKPCALTDKCRPIFATLTFAIFAVRLAARAGDVIYDDFAAPYLQRIDSISPGAGNANAVNSAIHVIDPWPRYSGNRHIPANGERMVGAVERYRDVSKLPQAPQPLAPVAIEASGLSSGGGGSSGGCEMRRQGKRTSLHVVRGAKGSIADRSPEEWNN